MVLVVLSVSFLLCSLFERLIQSRRVLAQVNSPVLTVASFPFTTGALNSMVLAAIFAFAAHFADDWTADGAAGVLFLAALVSLCNMVGFFFERQSRKFNRFTAFLIVLAACWILFSAVAVNFRSVVLRWEGSHAAVFFAVLTLVFNLPLIINYNFRKKGL